MWILLIVFTFSIIPKSQLHDWFTNHTDHYHYNPVGQEGQNIKAYEYNCGFVNDISVDPYTEYLFYKNLERLVSENSYTPTFAPVITGRNYLQNCLRGPPFIA